MQNLLSKAATLMKRGALFTGAAILALSLAGPGMAATNDADEDVQLDATQLAAVGEVNRKFNEVTTLQGNFIQVGPHGERAEGRFFLQKPGKIRFEYAPPSQLLVVSNGVWVGVTDRADKTTDRYPLRTTPLHLLLTQEIDLFEDTKIAEVYNDNGLITLVLEDVSGEAIGRLTLLFDAETLDLYQWIVTDAQGLDTVVTLTDVKEDEPANETLFVIPDDERYKRFDRDGN
ncbi:MAG: outer membrane lipoprotein carrier protein LolA [Hyphomicrobiales bacterium]|nr:outer membrane lipoprotein carrier protein LolA [Hyphomicrobiales bacterium]